MKEKAILLLFIFFLSTASVISAEEPVYFTDANLKTVVEEALDITDPTPTDMSGLISLDASGKGIIDLTGLEYAVNLQVLSTWFNKISDISALSGLTGLLELKLSSNRISDISALSGLRNLEKLELDGNRFNDILPLSGLTNLLELGLGNNRISDISPLSGLANLQTLYINTNQISDISSLSELTGLQYLHLGYNQIRSIPSLSGLANLQTLYINTNQINDISGLSGLTNLTNLHLENNQITSIPLLQGLTRLWEMRLENNQISDISGLSTLTNLGRLKLENNQLEDISPLSGLTNLRSLDLNTNKIRDISGLSELTSLEFLYLKNNQISDLSPLSGLANLKNLWLRDNQISKIPPLSSLVSLIGLDLSINQISDSDILPLYELTSLQWLTLNNNQISDLSPLSGLTSLRQLELNNNQISDISPLSGLTNLKWLYLSGNQISDISLITGFTNLIAFTIRANPLGVDTFNIHIIELQSNGIGVVYDPPLYTLSATSTAGGSISAPGEGFYDFDHGTTATLTAIPQLPNYHFVNWTGTAVDAGRVADPNVANTTAIIYSDYTLRANFILVDTGHEENRTVIYVDDDAPNDPGANDPQISDPNENGSQEHPYDAIQEGIDAAVDYETVIVAAGTYTGEGNRDIDFKGKAITVKSEQGPSTCIIDCQSYEYLDKDGYHRDYHRGFYFHNDEDANSVVQGFTITNGRTMGHDPGGGILCDNSSPRIQDCIIVDNQARKGGGVAVINSNAQIIGCLIKKNVASSGGGIEVHPQNDGIVLIKGCIISGNRAVWHPRFGGDGGGIRVGSSSNIVNCTITGNLAGYCGGGICFHYGASVSNSIIWNNIARLGDGNDVVLTYKCDSQRKLPHVFIEYSLVGFGNEDDFGFRPESEQCLDGQWLQGDPSFTKMGYWNPNTTSEDLSDDFWVDGDYHLKSQAGRFDPKSQNWIQDAVTSPCIDSGDPNSPIGVEPVPNGGLINMGAYGGTAEASKS